MLDLETWLRNKNMTTKEFVTLIGCSRQVIWKVKRNFPIDPSIALEIEKATNGEVSPKSHPIGIRWS